MKKCEENVFRMFLSDEHPKAYEAIRDLEYGANLNLILCNQYPVAYEAANTHLVEFRKFMEKEAIKWEKLADKYPGLEFPPSLEDYRSE